MIHSAPEKAKVEESILDALSDGRLHATADIVTALSSLGAEKVKSALLDLAGRYAIALQRHNQPANPIFGNVSLMPCDELGNVYIAASLRDDNPLSSVDVGSHITKV